MMMVVSCEEFFLCLNIPLLKKESCGWFFDRITFSRFLFSTNFGEKIASNGLPGFSKKTFESTRNQVITIFFLFLLFFVQENWFYFFSEICFSASDVIFVEMTHLNCKIFDVATDGFYFGDKSGHFLAPFLAGFELRDDFQQTEIFFVKTKMKQQKNQKFQSTSKHHENYSVSA